MEESAARHPEGSQFDPDCWSSRETLAAITLWTNPTGDATKLCQDLIEKYKGSRPIRRANLAVLICSLAARANIDRPFLSKLADEAFSADKASPLTRLARGMAAYRCGRCEDCLNMLPESAFVSPKERLLALVFHSMAQCRLGDASAPRKVLEQARQDFAGPFPYSDRVMTSGEADPVAWCMMPTTGASRGKSSNAGGESLTCDLKLAISASCPAFSRVQKRHHRLVVCFFKRPVGVNSTLKPNSGCKNSEAPTCPGRRIIR